eukprot:502538-Amphidinium_carterae.1
MSALDSLLSSGALRDGRLAKALSASSGEATSSKPEPADQPAAPVERSILTVEDALHPVYSTNNNNYIT